MAAALVGWMNWVARPGAGSLDQAHHRQNRRLSKRSRKSVVRLATQETPPGGAFSRPAVEGDRPALGQLGEGWGDGEKLGIGGTRRARQGSLQQGPAIVPCPKA